MPAASRRFALYVEPFMRIAAALALLIPSILAADLPLEVRRLTGLASALPAEFQADALLRIAESQSGMDADQRRELIEQALTMARQARYPYPKVAVRNLSPESRQAFESKAMGMRLDRLSLEMRAIRDLLTIDPGAARLAFEQTPKPAPAPVTCEDALIPRLDDYFDTAAQVISRGFTPKEMAREEQLALLLHIMAGVRSPDEAGPAARLSTNANLTARQFEAGLNAFTARLEAIGLDDRAFSETSSATQEEIAALASRAEGMNISRASLGRAYRKYLTAHFAAPKCADTIGRAPAEWFNHSALRGSLPPIEEKDLAAHEGAGTIHVDPFWTTADSARILNAAQALRASPGGLAYSMEERSTTEWNQKLQDFLVQLSEWKQTGEESALDFFHQKATVYQALVEICPSGEGRQRLMQAFVAFLRTAEAGASSPADWFWHVQNLHYRLRQGGDSDAGKLLAAYRSSGNLMLEMYAEFNGK